MRPAAGLKLSLSKITTVVTFIQLKYEGNIKLVGMGKQISSLVGQYQISGMTVVAFILDTLVYQLEM